MFPYKWIPYMWSSTSNSSHSEKPIFQGHIINSYFFQNLVFIDHNFLPESIFSTPYLQTHLASKALIVLDQVTHTLSTLVLGCSTVVHKLPYKKASYCLRCQPGKSVSYSSFYVLSQHNNNNNNYNIITPIPLFMCCHFPNFNYHNVLGGAILFICSRTCICFM